MINLKLLYKIIGSLLFIETTMFLVCLGVAIGYEEEDIFPFASFVIEAIVLCIFGGMIGILIGVFNGFVLGKAAEFVIQNMYSEYSSYIIMSVRPSLSAIVLSLFFSMLTGVFFGYYPANKAAKMEVIDALRYE